MTAAPGVGGAAVQREDLSGFASRRLGSRSDRQRRHKSIRDTRGPPVWSIDRWTTAPWTRGGREMTGGPGDVSREAFGPRALRAVNERRVAPRSRPPRATCRLRRRGVPRRVWVLPALRSLAAVGPEEGVSGAKRCSSETHCRGARLWSCCGCLAACAAGVAALDPPSIAAVAVAVGMSRPFVSLVQLGDLPAECGGVGARLGGVVLALLLEPCFAVGG